MRIHPLLCQICEVFFLKILIIIFIVKSITDVLFPPLMTFGSFEVYVT